MIWTAFMYAPKGQTLFIEPPSLHFLSPPVPALDVFTSEVHVIQSLDVKPTTLLINETTPVVELSGVATPAFEFVDETNEIEMAVNTDSILELETLFNQDLPF